MKATPYLISSPSVIEAWRDAASFLVDQGPRFNLAVHIENPAELDESHLAKYDPRNVKNVTSVYDVASTIFPPEKAWNFTNRGEFYRKYSRVYARGHKRRTWAWGTYFQRLIEFGGPEGNQVERAIAALGNWGIGYRAAVVIHLSAATLDRPRPLGAPCWQYGQFNVDEGQKRISFTAVYRSHDYFEKALGNFAGLVRLLKFVCRESGAQPGSLTCLSTFANLGSSKAAANKLLKLC